MLSLYALVTVLSLEGLHRVEATCSRLMALMLIYVRSFRQIMVYSFVSNSCEPSYVIVLPPMRCSTVSVDKRFRVWSFRHSCIWYASNTSQLMQFSSSKKIKQPDHDFSVLPGGLTRISFKQGLGQGVDRVLTKMVVNSISRLNNTHPVCR